LAVQFDGSRFAGYRALRSRIGGFRLIDFRVTGFRFMRSRLPARFRRLRRRVGWNYRRFPAARVELAQFAFDLILQVRFIADDGVQFLAGQEQLRIQGDRVTFRVLSLVEGL
jgi:hypothetical protein